MKLLSGFLLFLLSFGPAFAQERFSIFVPTDHDDVARMVKLADVRKGDVVFDLGSGDGRIVIEAARRNPGVRGRGIEIDENLVNQSRRSAQAAGVADRVDFLHQNAFDADLSEATVIVMWLWPELMRMLRPKILREARPGTRVITRIWDLGSWPPDQTVSNDSQFYKWIVPARVEGYWSWDLEIGGQTRAYAGVIDHQSFQKIEGVVRVGNRRGVFDRASVNGARVSLALMMTIEGLGTVRHEFTGRMNPKNRVIEGTAKVWDERSNREVEMPWRAERVKQSRYFAPTGTGAH
jgi:precorrin-6B methylase 2